MFDRAAFFSNLFIFLISTRKIPRTTVGLIVSRLSVFWSYIRKNYKEKMKVNSVKGIVYRVDLQKKISKFKKIIVHKRCSRKNLRQYEVSLNLTLKEYIWKFELQKDIIRASDFRSSQIYFPRTAIGLIVLHLLIFDHIKGKIIRKKKSNRSKGLGLPRISHKNKHV